MDKPSNKDIVAGIKLLGDLLELHGENSFKVRSYQNAYSTLKKIGEPISDMTEAELSALPGMGKSILATLREIVETGTTTALEALKDKTPTGVIEMFKVKGIGPKRIETLWKQLGITDVSQLINECHDNRLSKAKGFGLKTQLDILNRATLYLNSKGSMLYAEVLPLVTELKATLDNGGMAGKYFFTGAFSRMTQVISEIELVCTKKDWNPPQELNLVSHFDDTFHYTFKDSVQLIVKLVRDNAAENAFIHSFVPEVLEKLNLQEEKIDGNDEREYFKSVGLPYVIPELRWTERCLEYPENELLCEKDLLGIVHCHTTASDGINTLEEMCSATKQAGYHYLGISDHSRSAGYAGGLDEDRIAMQQNEIAVLQAKMGEFKILSSVESDILTSGELDYSNDVLATFDFVIGSIHSVLNMDIEKATVRLIKAIENPYLHILGHMTGRLLLTRNGYPLHIEKILDACAANKVVVELNANPRRLDIDYTLISSAVDRGIMISINPDAHSISGLSDVKYGVIAARAGGLLRNQTLNALPVEQFLAKLKK